MNGFLSNFRLSNFSSLGWKFPVGRKRDHVYVSRSAVTIILQTTKPQNKVKLGWQGICVYRMLLVSYLIEQEANWWFKFECTHHIILRPSSDMSYALRLVSEGANTL